MKIKIQVVIEHEDEILGTLVEEISYLQRGTPSLETLGLTLAEGKEILANLQEQIVKQQVTEHVQKFQICSGSTGHREHQKDTEIPEPFLCELCVSSVNSASFFSYQQNDDTQATLAVANRRLMQLSAQQISVNCPPAQARSARKKQAGHSSHKPAQ